MLSNGTDTFWYWDVGAFVFSGDKTAVSGALYLRASLNGTPVDFKVSSILRL